MMHKKGSPYSVFSPYWNLEISIQIRTTLFPFGFEVLIQYTFTNFTLSFVFCATHFFSFHWRGSFLVHASSNDVVMQYSWVLQFIKKIARWLRMGEDKRCHMKRHIMCVPFHSQNVGRWKDIGSDNIDKQYIFIA